MYWNRNISNAAFRLSRLIETWDVLKSLVNLAKVEVAGLIETWDVLKFLKYFGIIIYAIRLIETWDVLKYCVVCPKVIGNQINRNMRCIEIRNGSGRAESGNMINRNMRCIEIRQWALPWCCQRRLIETWDVLKYTVLLPDLIQRERLIETWDVLKFKAAALLRRVVPD